MLALYHTGPVAYKAYHGVSSLPTLGYHGVSSLPPLGPCDLSELCGTYVCYSVGERAETSVSEDFL